MLKNFKFRLFTNKYIIFISKDNKIIMWNKNSGYVGNKMSVRAVEAYDRGELPKSKINKAMMINFINESITNTEDAKTKSKLAKINFKSMDKNTLITRYAEYAGYHHTGKYCRITDFYDLSPITGEELLEKHNSALAVKLKEHYKKFNVDQIKNSMFSWPMPKWTAFCKTIKGHGYQPADVENLMCIMKKASPAIKDAIIQSGFADLLRQGNYDMSYSGCIYRKNEKPDPYTYENKLFKVGMSFIDMHDQNNPKFKTFNGKYWSEICNNATNSKNITLEKPEQKLEIQQKGMQR